MFFIYFVVDYKFRWVRVWEWIFFWEFNHHLFVYEKKNKLFLYWKWKWSKLAISSHTFIQKHILEKRCEKMKITWTIRYSHSLNATIIYTLKKRWKKSRKRQSTARPSLDQGEGHCRKSLHSCHLHRRMHSLLFSYEQFT